jgi:hypothetical protein
LLSSFSFLFEQCFERVVADVAAADEPFVVLLDHDAGGEPDQLAVAGDDADDVGAPADLAVDRSSGLVERRFGHWSAGKL